MPDVSKFTRSRCRLPVFAINCRWPFNIPDTRENDVLVVTKLDRLARSVSELLEIVNTPQTKKVSLRILNLRMDTQTPTGKLLTILGSIAQFEREIMLERQREGIAKAKKEGYSLVLKSK
ncbi:MAG: recombinase family protein [Legionellales bacterium]|nr:recombinase family protein [Legionellales bacterium]